MNFSKIVSLVFKLLVKLYELDIQFTLAQEQVITKAYIHFTCHIDYTVGSHKTYFNI